MVFTSTRRQKSTVVFKKVNWKNHCSNAVVFNLFHTVAHFPTQGNLTTRFGEQNLILVAKIWLALKKSLHLKFVSDFSIIMTSLYKSSIAFILIYALWPTENSATAHHWAMAHRLKTTALMH